MSQEQIDKLASVYNHVDDIDLYIAGLMETPASGSLLGPTFSYIIANQVNMLSNIYICIPLYFIDVKIKVRRQILLFVGKFCKSVLCR